MRLLQTPRDVRLPKTPMGIIASEVSPIHYDGVHTVMPPLRRVDYSHPGLPEFIRKNKGLPPWSINYGADDRSYLLKSMLDPDQSVIISELFEPGNRGRSAIVAGVYHYTYGEEGNKKTIDIPVVGIPTAMGGPTSVIIMREVFAHTSLAPVYCLNGRELKTRKIESGRPVFRTIRGGTSGGCNGNARDTPLVDRPDIVIASLNYGLGGTELENMGYPPDVLGRGRSNPLRIECVEKLARYGSTVADVIVTAEKGNGQRTRVTWHYLVNQNDVGLLNTIAKSVEELEAKFHIGNTFSKHGLGIEGAAPRLFVALAERHGHRNSEMEQYSVRHLAGVIGETSGIEIKCGNLNVVVGATPPRGTGYPAEGNQEHDAQIGTGMKQVLFAALNAIGRTVAGLQKKNPLE